MPNVARGWGQNVRLTPADIKRAVFADLQRIAEETGKVVPQDLIEFIGKGDLVLLDENNERVDINSAVVTWDN